MTLDCHLHLSDELEVPDGQLWRHMDQGLESSGICAFPYGILEIKLQVSARVPSLSPLVSRSRVRVGVWYETSKEVSPPSAFLC